MELTTSIDFQSLHSLYEKEKKENAELKTEVLKLQVHLQKVLQMIYGGKGERFVPNPAQLTLELVAETPAPATDLAKAKKVEYVKTGQPKKRELPELSTYMDYLPVCTKQKNPKIFLQVHKRSARKSTWFWKINRAKFLYG